MLKTTHDKAVIFRRNSSFGGLRIDRDRSR